MQALVNPGFTQASIPCFSIRRRKSLLPNFARPAFGLGVLLASLAIDCRAAAAATFSNATPLMEARGGQTATLLSNGKLLVIGGQTNGGSVTATAELYDPAVGTWTLTGSMNTERADHTATLLPNGKVLVAGGYDSANNALSSAELYDPLVGTWTNTRSMAAPRFLYTATLLASGQVLIVGGTTDGSIAIPNAELYDPKTGLWTATNLLKFARFFHTATLLPNGQVLISGGKNSDGSPVSSAELFDPATGVWTTANSLSMPRYSHTAALLPSGQVLVAGGTTNAGTAISSAELYDPSSGRWAATNSLITGRFNHTSTLLPNGSLLVTGGTIDGSASLTNAEVFNFGNGTWTGTNSLNSARYSHTATLLANGEVVVVGGFSTNQPLSSVERFDPTSGAWIKTGSMTVPQNYLTQTLLANGKVLVLGGGYNSAELYDPSTGSWVATSPMTTARFSPSVTTLSNGKVLVSGGSVGGTALSSAELYDPLRGTWTLTSSMHQVRLYHTATLLANGDVLVAGGVTSGNSSIGTAELYHTASGTWTTTGPLNVARAGASATFLFNGKVLVAGGFRGTTNLTSAELYDSASGTWTLTGQLSEGRENNTATLLLNGKVLVVAGYGNSGALTSAELYDPTTGTWSLTAPIPGPRYYHTAILLPDGKTLVAGGSNGRSNVSSAFLYDAPTETWRQTASMINPRAGHAASLLSGGKVFVAGGFGTTSNISSAELYDPGLGFHTNWQPQITSVSLLNSNSGITISGSGFRGISEASSGGTQDSPADYPVFQIMSIEGGPTLFLTATNWSANSMTCPPASSLPPGYLLGTVFVNGIPSPGQIFKIPTAPFIANLPASALGATTATLNGQVLDTGGNTPTITIYYGTTDGGTNAAAWSNSISGGPQSGVFAQALNGLTTNTTYYFTARAVNIVGASWATPSQSFTTVTLPTVANLPASDIQGTFATFNGQVLSTGRQTPTVTIFYGTTDGGINPGAWAHSIMIGPQSGPFAQMIYDLATNTAYFYTAQAVNAAGTNWASPSRSLITAATNSPVLPSVAVLTHHNDNGRTGMNLNEPLLNVSNVNSRSFGLLYTRPVDDQIYAQPLIVTNVNVLGRGTHNIVIVATVNDTIYAFDADNASAMEPYWTNSFINPPNIVPPNNADESAIGACGGAYVDYSGSFGIVGTPVIDPDSGTLYVVARTKEFGTNFVQRLHALDITTGLDRSNSPAVITATYPGNGAASVGGVVSFDPLRNNQRPALTLANGILYISWSSHCDNGPYHGWVMGYNAATLQQVAVFNATPNGSEGGIWMSGQGPSADDLGNIYLSVGNGSVDATDFGESFLKLAASKTGTRMTVATFFIPLIWSTLNAGDIDLGSAGLLLIPDTKLAISGGKQGVLYLVARDEMLGISSAIQSWPVGTGEIHGGPVWWTGANGSFMYIWPDTGGRLQQYQFTGSSFNTVPYAQSSVVCGGGSPGGILCVSASGTNAGSGILWAVVNTAGDANHVTVAGTLHAYDAQNVTSELWNSDMVPRDSLPGLAKFVPPTVANGKVYMATFSGQLNVYGLFPMVTNLNAATLQNRPMSVSTAKLLSLASDPYGFPLAITGVSATSTNGGAVTMSADAVTYTPVNGFVGADRFTYTVGNPQDASSSAYVFVQVLSTNAGPANLLPPLLGLGDDAIIFAGVPGLTYTLQRASAVAGPWTNIATVTVGGAGIGTYLDPSKPAGSAFYRITYP
jgi:N-acetylneuraminic acid mutarotase